MSETDYSEKIEFSEHGIRLVVLSADGEVSHLDNWELEMFGGTLPAAGDHITTLWDPERPEPAESYLVLERHWIGELKGDNCWWLLLKEVEPTSTHRLLFDVAREQSARTRRFSGSSYADLLEVRKLLEQANPRPRKRPTRSDP